MKKLLVILAALLIATSLIACNKEDDTNKPKDTEGTTISVPTESGTSGEDETTTPDKTDTPASERDFVEKNDIIVAAAKSGAIQLRTDTNMNSSSKADSVKNGTELERVASDGEWSKVKYNGNEYYVINTVIVEKSVLDGFDIVSATIQIKEGLSVRVRSFPNGGTDSSLITDVKSGDTLEVVGYNSAIGQQGWYKVKLTTSDDQPLEYGYISAHDDYSTIIEGSVPGKKTSEASTETQTEAQTEAQG